MRLCSFQRGKTKREKEKTRLMKEMKDPAKSKKEQPSSSAKIAEEFSFETFIHLFLDFTIDICR